MLGFRIGVTIIQSNKLRSKGMTDPRTAETLLKEHTQLLTVTPLW